MPQHKCKWHCRGITIKSGGKVILFQYPFSMMVVVSDSVVVSSCDPQSIRHFVIGVSCDTKVSSGVLIFATAKSKLNRETNAILSLRCVWLVSNAATLLVHCPLLNCASSCDLLPTLTQLPYTQTSKINLSWQIKFWHLFLMEFLYCLKLFNNTCQIDAISDREKRSIVFSWTWMQILGKRFLESQEYQEKVLYFA